MRARMSEPPPAGNGTIMVIGFDGKVCARAPMTQPAMSDRKHSSDFIVRSTAKQACTASGRAMAAGLIAP